MATGWVKSLQCKSRAVDDVVSSNKHHYHHLISPSSSCRKSIQSFNDVVDTKKHKPKKKPKTSPPLPPPPTTTSTKTKPKQPVSTKPDSGTKQPVTRARPSSTTRHSRATEQFFPALTELPEGHPSRNVVEIIFHTSWTPKAFSGRIEMVFKVQNLARTVTRFEEYREKVKSRVADSGVGDGGCEDRARCVVDGNEVMRFHCLGPAGGGSYDPSGCAWAFHSGKGAAICTFSGSGGAHENAGGGKGRRAMMVCRVIAGRVCKRTSYESVLEGRVGCDSVSGENSELIVFDSRAVLPCFLIIYKL